MLKDVGAVGRWMQERDLQPGQLTAAVIAEFRIECTSQRPPQRLPASLRDQIGHLHLVGPTNASVDAGRSCNSRVPLRTTVINCRPGSIPASVVDSNSDARAPVDT
jgi:hypothetical protein